MFRLLMVATLAAQVLGATRTVDHQTVRSTALPALTVTVSADLPFVGELAYSVRDVAAADEFIFAQSHNGKLERLFIAHFEHFLDSNADVFRYPRLEMAQLGGHEYLHQTWAIKQFDLFTDADMAAFLRSHRLTAEPSWLVDRYVRVVDEVSKHEMIFFYLEAASLNSGDIHYGGAPAEPPPPPKPPAAVTARLLEHAAHAFHVADAR
jgi:hypothetical protein